MTHTAMVTTRNTLDSRVQLERAYPFPADHPAEPIVWWIVSGVVWLLPTLFFVWLVMALGWAGIPWWPVIAAAAFGAVCIASFRHAGRLHAARAQAQRRRARMERALDAIQGQDIVRASARILHLWMTGHPDQLPRDGVWYWVVQWGTRRSGARPVSYVLKEVHPQPMNASVRARKVYPRFPEVPPSLARKGGGLHLPAHMAAPAVPQADWEETVAMKPVIEVRIGPLHIDTAHQRMALIAAIDERYPAFPLNPSHPAAPKR